MTNVTLIGGATTIGHGISTAAAELDAAIVQAIDGARTAQLNHLSFVAAWM